MSTTDPAATTDRHDRLAHVRTAATHLAPLIAAMGAREEARSDQLAALARDAMAESGLSLGDVDTAYVVLEVLAHLMGPVLAHYETCPEPCTHHPFALALESMVSQATGLISAIVARHQPV